MVNKKIKKINEKIGKFNRKIGLFVFGFISSIGLFAMAVAGTVFLESLFISFAEYFKIIVLVVQCIFVLTFYRISKEVEQNFTRGYLIGSSIFVIIIIIGIILGGVRWSF